MPPLEDYIWVDKCEENVKVKETDFFASQEGNTSAQVSEGNTSANVSGPPPKQPQQQDLQPLTYNHGSPSSQSHPQLSPSHTNIPLRKTHSTNPFKIRETTGSTSSGAGLHDSILQLLKQEGEKIYPAHTKTKKRPRLKRTSTGDSRGSETPAPVPLEQQTENASNIAAGSDRVPSKATSSPLSTPSPPPSMSQVAQSNGAVNESLRIMYDDPEARNERKRILQALTHGSSSDPRNSHGHTGVSRSDENENEGSDVMYRFAKEDFEKPIAETRPKRGAAKEGSEKINQQYDPTQLDEF